MVSVEFFKCFVYIVNYGVVVFVGVVFEIESDVVEVG